MVDLLVETIWGLFKLTAWVGWQITRFTGGLFIGHMRTRSNLKGYHPKRLGVPHTTYVDDIAIFTLSVPQSQTWDAEHALRFMTAVLTLGRCLLQIVAEQSGIVFRVVFIDGVDPNLARDTLLSFYPTGEVTVTPYTENRIKTFPKICFSMPLVAANIFPAPIMTVDLIKYFDPLISLTQAISDLKFGERVLYTLAVLDFTSKAAEAGYKLVTTSDIHPIAYTGLDGVLIAEMRKSKGWDRIPRFEGSVQRVLEEKLNSDLYHCLLFVQAEASTRKRAREVCLSVLPHALQFANPAFNGLILPEAEKDEGVADITAVTSPEDVLYADFLVWVSTWLSQADKKQSWKRCLLVLHPEELAALWHLPYQGFTAQAIQWLPSRLAPLPQALRQLSQREQGIFIGTNRYAGKDQAVYLPDDDRTSHTLILGKTGTGKSSLLHRMIYADMHSGRGLCVIDPHGTLIRSLLQHSIPKGREKDVVILDLNNQVDGVSYPPPLNILARPEGVTAEVATGMLMGVLEKTYDGFAETQMAHTLHMALLTLGGADKPTLLDIPRLFEDPAFREPLIEGIDNLTVQRFWRSFLSKSPREQEQMLYPVYRRLDSFTTNQAVLSLTCHPYPISLSELIRRNKIILVSLQADEARVPSLERNLIGATLVAQLQMAAMAGAISRPPFLLYIDEAQQFVTTALSRMLSEARKSGLGLILANQYLKQLAGDTLEAIEGNIGTLMAFEVGESDARGVSTYLKPTFTPTDLVSLGKYRAAVSLRYQGSRQPPFSLLTLPPPQPESKAQANQREYFLRRKSVEDYTPMAYSEVTSWLKARYVGAQPTQPIIRPIRTDHDDEFLEPHP